MTLNPSGQSMSDHALHEGSTLVAGSLVLQLHTICLLPGLVIEHEAKSVLSHGVLHVGVLELSCVMEAQTHDLFELLAWQTELQHVLSSLKTTPGSWMESVHSHDVSRATFLFPVTVVMLLVLLVISSHAPRMPWLAPSLLAKQRCQPTLWPPGGLENECACGVMRNSKPRAGHDGARLKPGRVPLRSVQGKECNDVWHIPDSHSLPSLFPCSRIPAVCSRCSSEPPILCVR